MIGIEFIHEFNLTGRWTMNVFLRHSTRFQTEMVVIYRCSVLFTVDVKRKSFSVKSIHQTIICISFSLTSHSSCLLFTDRKKKNYSVRLIKLDEKFNVLKKFQSKYEE